MHKFEDVYREHLAPLGASRKDVEDWVDERNIVAVSNNGNNVIILLQDPADNRVQIQRWFILGSRSMVSVDYDGHAIDVIEKIIDREKLN
jgi:hypothetical protein